MSTYTVAANAAMTMPHFREIEQKYAFTQFIHENWSTENTDDNIYKYSEIQCNKGIKTYILCITSTCMYVKYH